MLVCQCKMKYEGLCLCFVKVGATPRCKCGAQSCTSLAFNTSLCTLRILDVMIILHFLETFQATLVIALLS